MFNYLRNLKSKFRLMEFYPKFGLGLTISSGSDGDGPCNDCYNELYINPIFGKFYLRIPQVIKPLIIKESMSLGSRPYDRVIRRTFGFTFIDESFLVYYGPQFDQWINGDPKNSDHSEIFTLPWRDWTFVQTELLDKNGDIAVVVPSDKFQSEEVEANRHLISEYPYSYKLKNGEVQATVASIHGVTRRWKLRWLPFIKRTLRVIEVDFSESIGERVSSWKGGCTGCSTDWKKGQTQEEALRLMEATRKF